MDPYDFELLLGDLFEAMGYATQVTQRSRDYGVDILIKLEHFGISHSWIVQAKKYNGSVGVREVREYGSLRMRDRVDGVIIVTTGYFTQDAIDEADQYNVKLICGDVLVGMLNRYLLALPPENNESGREINVNGSKTDLLLHDNEEILLREPVSIKGTRFELVLSNRNMFLKEIGFLSKNSSLKHKIAISKIIGAKQEKDGILLFIGGENIKTYLVKGNGRIMDILDRVKPLLPGQVEKFIKYSRSGARTTILTNRRLFFRENGNIWQMPLYRISGVDVKNGLIFSNSKLVLFITGESIESKELAVEDAKTWKSEIETAVRSSRVS
ncbi:MAG: restriction endonuclease [Candidatus Methanoperedens sp.]|nr:restriction endonuclease [Candidatus Methanoperedens sp.]MCZ7371702.1 restriction endonuclease [Candidatus Methanoperedens sp.]